MLVRIKRVCALKVDMIPRGTFQCPICKERHHVSKKVERYRSYVPKRKITICEYCYDDYRTDPKYEHLRPDIDPKNKQKIEKIREYNKKNSYLLLRSQLSIICPSSSLGGVGLSH